MNIICGIIVPRMLSPTSWNWGRKSGLFWGGVSGLTAIYLFLRLPESKNKSYGELDLLFERRVPAWRFKSTKVDREFCSVWVWGLLLILEFGVDHQVLGDEKKQVASEEERDEYAR